MIWLRTKKTHEFWIRIEEPFFFSMSNIMIEMTSAPLRNILYINRAHCHTYKQQNVEKKQHIDKLKSKKSPLLDSERR